MKQAYYHSIAYLQSSLQAEADQEYGKRLAYCEAANSKLAEALKIAGKETTEETKQALSFATDYIGGKYVIRRFKIFFVEIYPFISGQGEAFIHSFNPNRIERNIKQSHCKSQC